MALDIPEPRRMSQANVAVVGNERYPAGTAPRADGANVALTLYRHEGAGNTSTYDAYLTPAEAVALATKLLRGAQYDPAEDGSWWVRGAAR